MAKKGRPSNAELIQKIEDLAKSVNKKPDVYYEATELNGDYRVWVTGNPGDVFEVVPKEAIPPLIQVLTRLMGIRCFDHLPDN